MQTFIQNIPSKNADANSKTKVAEHHLKDHQKESFSEEYDIENNLNQFRARHNFNKIQIYSPLIQPKLTVNQSNDIYEQEADAMADKVMRMPDINSSQNTFLKFNTSAVQKKCAECEKEDEGKKLQRKASVSNIPLITTPVHQTLQSHGNSIDKVTQTFMENRFGHDFSKVQIHNNPTAHQSAKDINALAYTHGHNIVFNSGQYQPETNSGKHLLAHELTHVIQQSKNLKESRTVQRKGGTAGGFFSNLGRSFLSIFADEPGFSDETLKKYLTVLDSGEIEDDYDSDDKARIVVRKWLNNPVKMPLTQQRKLMLIKEMLSGLTLDDDENAILALLKKSTDEEVGFILNMVKPDILLDKINGKEHTELQLILADISKRKVHIGPKPVKEINAKRKNITELLGDGTRLNKGINIDEFHTYVTQQADWYTESTLTKNDRETLWNIAVTIYKEDYVASALGKLMLSDIAATIKTPDMSFILSYAEGASPSAQTIRITNPHDKISRVIELGKAMKELNTFVPGPVLRICIDQAQFEKLVDEKLIPEFKSYYKNFAPTIENPEETDYILKVLKDGIAAFLSLTDWIHDLHAITKKTRQQLVKNVTDKTRKRPVLLVLMSGLDWNGAFLQASNLEAAISNTKNLGLLIQGSISLKNEIAKLDKVADDYGQIPKGALKGRLGQVVIAGHGEDNLVEQITPGTGAASSDDKTVSYDEKDIKFGEKDADSEKLIDEALQRMDPAQARIVFAGCLVGSHDIKQGAITNTKKAAAEINAAIKADPNLRDQVNARMAALKIKGRVEAANASTPFGSFVLDSKGNAKLSLPEDPDIGGTKDEYVQSGMEPEGALRAALETWADPKFGPGWTTREMKRHVARTAGNMQWYICLTRTAFKLALPNAGDVDPMVINDLAHRVESWLFIGWEEMADVSNLNKDVKPAEITVLYPVMLGSEFKAKPHLPIVVQQAWMQMDAKHEADFMHALNTTVFKRVKLSPLIADALIQPHLITMFKTAVPAKPTKGQLLLALTMAVNDGAAMPAEVKALLINAAGGIKTTKFPAALNVSSLLDGSSESTILQDIGLAPGSAPQAGIKSEEEGNLDIDKNKKNESFVSVKPRQLTLAFPVIVQLLPNLESKILKKLVAGETIRIVGTTNGWSVIDLNGTTGFVLYNFV